MSIETPTSPAPSETTAQPESQPSSPDPWAAAFADVDTYEVHMKKLEASADSQATYSESTPNQLLQGEFAAERDYVLADPEHVGVVMEEHMLPDWRLRLSLAEVKSRWPGAPETLIQTALSREADKPRQFQEYIDSYLDDNGTSQLQHVRINYGQATSPLCLMNAERSDGSIGFADELVQSIDYMRSRNIPDITLVAGFLHRTASGEIAGTPPDTGEYAHMIAALVEKISHGDGAGLTIEIGNETNFELSYEDPATGANYTLPRLSPAEYGQFYQAVATQLKSKFPELRLALAGTMGPDRSYLEQTLSAIGDANLVDAISVHPYRDSATSQAWIPAESADVPPSPGEKLGRTEQPYFELIGGLKDLAAQYGAQFSDVFQFDGDADSAHANMRTSLAAGAAQDIVSYVQPRTGFGYDG